MRPGPALRLLAAAATFLLAAPATAQEPSQAPAIALPAPDGRYAVGIRAFEIQVPGRPAETASLPSYIWYPANAAKAASRPYMSADEAAVQARSLARIYGYEADALDHLPRVAAHSSWDAPPVRSGRFPVIIFSHGFYSYPAQNTVLAEQLASHGYIVVAISHPTDSVDIRLASGRVVATDLSQSGDNRLGDRLKLFASDKGHDARTSALSGYREDLARHRLGRSLERWRDDTVRAEQVLRRGEVEPRIRDVIRHADPGRLALAGMSFGGATSATTCKLIAACRAAVNLDGQNFDPALFDAEVERPLLLLLSDWTRFPVMENQWQDPSVTPNDYAYEPWRKAGRSGRVLRLRFRGARHLAFTDLPLLMPGPKAAERFGAIDPQAMTREVNAIVLAFLDEHLKGGSRTATHRAIAGAKDVARHRPRDLRRWARSRHRH
jgi:predicted dienelactone hydrolase